MSLNWLLYNLSKNPGTIGVYMTDRYEHVKIFSSKRVLEAVEQSQYLSAITLKNKSSISRLPFRNGSNLYMLSAWNDFESARSIPADFVVVDEMQSINVSALPVLTESMVRSRFRKIIKVGTGSDEGDAWWTEWHLGTQYQWDKNLIDSSGRQGNWIVTPNTISVPGISSYRIPWDL
ncbi:MAG: hypothetical protein KGH95_07860, partial [Thaumarchaeota archaeon]|nr:hypothetical protein [Nitrososphaerota archaeon]